MICILLILSLIAPSLTSRLPYVIGGSDVTTDGKYPWQGSLTIDGDHACGCSLISSQWILTAAHCAGLPVRLYSAKFNTNYLSKTGVVISVKNITKHPDYGLGPGVNPNDIAVMKLSGPATGEHVAAVKLAQTGDFADHPDCWITGWGYTTTGTNAVVSEVLQEAQVEVYTQDSCRNIWGETVINDGHVCVGVWGKVASCNGDSGGPLVCRHRDGDFEQVGVTSWGSNGCYPLYPSVYTRVTYFRKWITDVTGI